MKDDRTTKALEALKSAKDALIREMSAGQGKARLHSPTFVSVCEALNFLEGVTSVAPSPKEVGMAKAKQARSTTKPEVAKD